MNAPKREERERLAIKVLAKSAAWLAELQENIIGAGFTVEAYFTPVGGKGLCVIGGSAKGLSRDCLRPHRYLGGLLRQLNVNFERVNCTAIDKEVRAFAMSTDSEGLTPVATARLAILRKSKAELKEIQAKGAGDWYSVKRRYLSLLHEQQMPPFVFAGMVQDEGDEGGLLVTMNLE